MKTIKVLILITSVILVSCNGNSNRKEAVKTMDDNTMVMTTNEKDNEQEFIKDALGGGLLEVELGNVAQQNARHPRVKNFGAMMIRDHSKANDDLKSLAASKNITLPDKMSDDHRSKLDDMQKKTGADFDKAYINDMVEDHQKDIDKFRKEAESGSDQDIKSFAIQTLPILQAHLDSAKNIKNGLK